MENPRRLFVLGAGVSCPFGFPTGLQLRKKIIETLGKKYVQDILCKVVFGSGDKITKGMINGFVREYESSNKETTIDEFMQNHSSLEKIGKVAISFVLLREEKNNRALDKDWYSWLFNILKGKKNDVDEFGRDTNMQFLTFNYDRSLEHYLFTRIKSFFGENIRDTDHIKRIIDRNKIDHVYGQVGYLEWQNNENINYYGAGISNKSLLNASNSFKFMYEGKEVSPVYFDPIEASISWAEEIYFLGFGYDRLNLINIFLHKDSLQWEFPIGFRLDDRKKILKKVRGGTILGKETVLKELKQLYPNFSLFRIGEVGLEFLKSLSFQNTPDSIL